ncbi:MAG: AtpZ/AtpI family protein [Phycisphaerales bacterium]|nr:AtpZ/AtpI family protein [Phycisphaerales bacterium]MCB9836574.1 AtpZ/AtpI family protein [Phycisphaera sp.]
MTTDQPNQPERKVEPPEADDPRLAIPEILREQPSRSSTDKSTPKREDMGETAKAWGMALDLVFTTIGGLAIGWGIDYWQKTGPWGAIIGLALGFMLAATRMIRSTLKAEAREQAERERRRQSERTPDRPD